MTGLSARQAFAVHAAARLALARPWWPNVDGRAVRDALRAYDAARPSSPVWSSFVGALLGGAIFSGLAAYAYGLHQSRGAAAPQDGQCKTENGPPPAVASAGAVP